LLFKKEKGALRRLSNAGDCYAPCNHVEQFTWLS